MTFPTNIPAVTVWEKTLVNRAPAYIRHELGACYWEDNRRQSVQADDVRKPDDSIFLAVPVGSITDYVPKKDDRVMPGNISDAAPPSAALTVMQVKNFLYASAMMQHLEVTAK